MNTTKKIIASLLAGAAVGVIAGILLAPDKGSATRAKLKAKGKELSDQFKDTMQSCKEKVNDLKQNREEYV